MKIKIECLTKDGLQLRECLSEDVVSEYAEAMRNGAVFPPVTAFFDGKKTYLADGFHRVEAAQRAGFREIDADVRKGDYFAAEAFACGANSVTPRSAETKKRCVLRLWEHRKEHFGKDDPSDREIANLSKLPRSTVKTIISELANVGQLILPKTVTGIDGKTRARALPTRPPTRQMTQKIIYTPPVRTLPNRATSDAEQDSPKVKRGYHIGTDGKTHADGVILDRFGVEIPERIRTAFSSEFLNGVISQLQAARTMLKRAQDDKDICVAAVSQRAGLEMENAYHELKAAKPFCVCRMCQGQGCAACKETGFQTEDQFNRNPPEMNP